ncbi:MAG: D-aminoacyl-tRNA deacylase [Bacilli bacterium]
MRVVVQRALRGHVEVENKIVGQIQRGLVLLVGITHTDTVEDVRWMADKIAGLRIFDDAEGRMNLSVQDVEGEVLSISQFTLYGDCRKGRRPNYMGAAKPDIANPLYEQFNEQLRVQGLSVSTGVFGAHMHVDFINDGPVTLILDTADR